MYLLIPRFLLCITLQSVLVNSQQKIYIATKGEVWPKPQEQLKSDDYYVIRPSIFQFNTAVAVNCMELLNSTYRRYQINEANQSTNKIATVQNNFLGYIDQLNVTIRGKCPSNIIVPSLEMVEKYTLSISSHNVSLEAISFWGVLRGLETFSQLVYYKSETNEFRIRATHIVDWPRFPHRGLLLDTSRHFIPVPLLLTNLRAMSYNKLNVFHWHLTDDESFPYWSKTYPELSKAGAYHPVKAIYNSTDVAQVIEYARVRGIRVIPEFDVPGHTGSWGNSHPEILTSCYTKNKLNGLLGSMNPSKNKTFKILAKFFKEVVQVFPDNFVHIGGDGVDFACWKSNENITAFMLTNKISNYKNLENYFLKKIVAILKSHKTKYLVYDEVFRKNIPISKSGVVQILKPYKSLKILNLVTKAGHYAVYSACWYLHHLWNGPHWERDYQCEPTVFSSNTKQLNLLIGGEACMWTDSVNEYNLISRIWPRASAVAEKLWSADGHHKNMNMVRRRLEEHTCRMNKRGIDAHPPNGPGACL